MTYGQILWTKQKEIKKREDFQSLVNALKEHISEKKPSQEHKPSKCDTDIQACSNTMKPMIRRRNERHYTFTEHGLKILASLSKGKNTSAVRSSILKLDMDLQIFGEEYMEVLILIERMRMNIQNTTLTQSAKQKILKDLTKIQESIEAEVRKTSLFSNSCTKDQKEN